MISARRRKNTVRESRIEMDKDTWLKLNFKERCFAKRYGDLFTAVGGEVEDEDGEEGYAHTGDDQVDGVEQGLHKCRHKNGTQNTKRLIIA